MKLLNFYNSIIKEDGFHIIDTDKNKIVIGKPKKNPPIILKLFKKDLNYKLLLFQICILEKHILTEH